MKMNKIFISLILLLAQFTYATEETDSILITAEKIQTPNETKAQSVVTRDEIEALPGATTPEIVANVMGVKLSKFGNGGQPSFISIRGSSPEQVLVLLNGKKLNSSQGGGVDLSIIPPESIERIEIIRGGDSAIYGGSAFGGVINIVTKEVKSSYITLKDEYDINNRNEASFNLFRTGDEYKLGSNINVLYIGNRENSDITSISSSINYQGLINQTELVLSGSIHKSDKGVPGTIEFPNEDARMEDLQINCNLGLNNTLFKWDLNYLYKLRNYSDPQNSYGAIDNTHDYKSLSTLLAYNSDFIDIELSGNYDYLVSDSYSVNYVDRVDLSLFASPELIFNKLEVKPSARINYDLEDSLTLSLSLGSLYNLSTDKIKIKGSIGSAFRKPSFNDLFWPDTSFASGNPELLDEHAIIGDLSLLYNLSTNIKTETTVYYHSISNLIQWNPGPSGVWTPKNIGSAEISGIESEIKYLIDFIPISGYLEGRLNYTFLNAINREKGILNGKKLINRATHKGNFILIYYSDLNFKLSADLSYTGDRFTTSANTKMAKGYLLLDLNFSKEIFNRTNLSIYGKNLLNIEYEDYRGYPVSGLNFGLTLEYRWGDEK